MCLTVEATWGLSPHVSLHEASEVTSISTFVEMIIFCSLTVAQKCSP